MAHVRNAAPPTCSICERSLLTGERPIRFSPDGREFVDVCPLCKERAVELGWLREGLGLLPGVQLDRRRQRRGLGALLHPRRGHAEGLSEPILRRLSQPEQAIVEAADLFNASAFVRTVDGIARSLGPPQVSVVPLSGINPEVVITVAWDISWYQYRVDFDSTAPVRLAERGIDPEEIEAGFTSWNARLSEDGLVVPEIEKL